MACAFEIYWAVSLRSASAGAACLGGGLSPKRTFPTKLMVPGLWVYVLLSPCSSCLCQGSSSVALRHGD
ncbi:hypothetical protein MRX96_032376 [Rhipicephalus microplus]